MSKLLFILLYLISSNAMAQNDLMYLTKSLDFLDSSHNEKKINVTKGLTLFKKIKTSGSVTEVELIQQNGVEKKERLFISTYWLKKGTDSHTKVLYTDPTPIISRLQKSLSGDLSCPDIEKPLEESPIDESACGILKSPLSKGSQASSKLFACFNYLQNQIPKDGTAYSRLKALYKLKPYEQDFMAKILTAYGEARGAMPKKQQLKAVMNVIDNRLSYAQKSHSQATALDIVFQKSQFSMYNPRDPNWKKSLTAKNNDVINLAIQAYVETKTEPSDIAPNVYHYMSSSLSKSSSRPSWATSSKKVRPLVDGLSLEKSPGHVFYKSVAWSFNPRNRYNI